STTLELQLCVDALPSGTTEAAHERAVEKHQVGHGRRIPPARERYRPNVRGVYAKRRVTRMETNFYSSAWFQVLQPVGTVHPDHVENLRGKRERERHGFPRSAELERLQHGLVLRLRTGLQLR